MDAAEVAGAIMTSQTSDTGGTGTLDARYGRTPNRRRREKLAGWTVGSLITLVFVAWVVWVAFDGADATIDARDIGHSVIDERSVRVDFEVSMPAGTSARCAVEAQNNTHAIVGWKLIDIEASDRFTRAVSTTVHTTELAVTGLIYQCWLA